MVRLGCWVVWHMCSLLVDSTLSPRQQNWDFVPPPRLGKEAEWHHLTFVRQIYDFMLTELTHNKTYAHHLPPTYYLHSARDLLNWHEDKIFSDVAMNGIGNSKSVLSCANHFSNVLYDRISVAEKTTMHSVLTVLERISFDRDPLKFLLMETTYQPFISLFHMTEIIADHHPHPKGLHKYFLTIFGGCIEFSRSPFSWLHVCFGHWTHQRTCSRCLWLCLNKVQERNCWRRLVTVFGHKGDRDIPLTEFIYRLEVHIFPLFYLPYEAHLPTRIYLSV